MSDTGLLAGLIGLVLAMPAQADTSSRLLDVLAGLGCAVGPEARMVQTLPASTPYAALRAFADQALDNGTAVQQGDWTVLNARTCTIRIPDLTSPVALDDPEAQAALSAVDAYPEDAGCFFETDRFATALMDTRGFTEDEAARAYIDMFGVAIAEGKATFYSGDPLRTPPGFQSLVGDCAEVPNIDLIRYNQSLLRQHFDTVVRTNAAKVRCGPSGPVVDFTAYRESLAAVSDGRPGNAFGGLELHVIAMAAGWVEGHGATDRGRPRPPICSHGD